MGDVLLDAFIDSLKVLAILLLFHILLSFFESKISKKLSKNSKVSPILGSLFGLIPQCGFSVVAADMYLKEHITTGTLLAVFIACSDEALPILLSNFKEAYYVLPLLLTKFVLAFCVGFLVDFIARKNKEKVHHHMEHCSHEEEIHIGCCHHEIDNEEESKLHKHLIHPLIHSLKIFIYVLIINLIFGFLIFYIGEDQITSFLSSTKYFGPVLATLIGLIPNCASSVIIANMFVMKQISFGTALAGLIVNAGIGMVILLKNKEKRKETALIFCILIGVAILIGYSTCLIVGF